MAGIAAAAAAADGDREGHVSRARLFGAGSVLARRLQEQRQQQQQQQLGQEGAEQHHDQQPAQITWPELWDARTTAGYVGLELGQQDRSAKAMQLWWSPYGRTPQEGGLKRKHSRLLQYSSLISRVLQRDGATTAGKNHHQQQQNTGQPASAPTSLSVIQPCELFGGASKRQRVQQQQAAAEASGSRPPPAAWVCCNHVPEGDAGSLPGGAAPCAAVNPAAASSCCECGAPAWDGPDGQLQHRITAALQTADLDVTNIRQVTARVLAESGSRPGVGLMPTYADMRPQVSRVLYDRKIAQAAAADGCPAGLVPAGGSGSSRPRAAGAGGPVAADELQLLEQHGCLPATEGVYSSLMAWLQQQPTQTMGQAIHLQQQQGVISAEGGPRLQSAAAAAAALAPRLLASLLRQQGDLPAPKLVPGSVLAWVNSCFQEAAAAAAQAHSATAQQDLQGPGGQPCLPLRRPLPTHTLLGLCDRRGAAVRQALADAAASCVAACGGRLPLLTRSYRLEGRELMSEEVPPAEWLWARWCCNHKVRRCLPARDDGVEDDEGDLSLQERLSSDDWDEVVFVRTRVQQLLQAWLDSLLAQQTAGGPQQQQQQQQQHRQPFVPHAWDRQMCRLLGEQVARTTQGWGAAPAWALRQALSRTRAPAPASRSTSPQQHAPAPQDRSRQGRHSAGEAAGLDAPAQQQPAGGRRRSLRLQAQGQAAEGQAAGQAAQLAAGGGSTAEARSSSGGDTGSSSSSSSSSSHGSSESDSDGSSWSQPDQPPRSQGQSDKSAPGSKPGRGSGIAPQQAGDQQQQGQHGSGDADDGWLRLTAWLASLDDLQLPQQEQGGYSSGPQPWQPAAGSAWRAVGSGRQAGAAVGAVGGTSGGGAGSSHQPAAEWASQLPAGMQAVLAQAAKAGVAPVVLQRTAVRLSELLRGGGG